MRALWDFLVALIALAAEGFARSVPPGAAATLAAVGGTVWYAVDGRRRRRARANLGVALRGGLPPVRRERLVRATFRNLMHVPLESAQLQRRFRTQASFLRAVRTTGDLDLLIRDLGRGRGGILLGGHLGSWEVAGYGIRFMGVDVRVVVRPIENPWIDRRAAAMRGGPGTVIPKRGAVLAMRRALAAGAWIGFMADQNAGSRGRFVPFFGLPASTGAAPAVLALRTGVPVYAGACLRRPGGRYDVHFRRLAGPSRPRRPSGAAVDALLGAYHEALQDWIRLAPDQYNWLHRRWRTRPADEPAEPHLPAYARQGRALAQTGPPGEGPASVGL